MYFPSLLRLPPTCSHPIPLGHHRALGWAPCIIHHLPISCQFYTWWYIYVNATLLIHLILFFPPCVHRTVLHVCISISAQQIGLSVTFFQMHRILKEKKKQNQYIVSFQISWIFCMNTVGKPARNKLFLPNTRKTQELEGPIISQCDEM